MDQKSQAPKRKDLTADEVEAALWQHRLRFRENYIKPDTPHWKRYMYEIIASDRPAGEKLLGIVLAMHADEETGENAYPSHRRLEALTSISRPTLRAYIAKLQEDGWITKETGAGRSSNSYTLTIPQRTIDELIVRFAVASGKAAYPQNGSDAERSGKAAYPQDLSGKATYPQIESVVGKPFTHKDAQSSRSGKIDPRSGKVAYPNLIPINTLELEGSSVQKRNRAQRTRLPDEWNLPDDYRSYPHDTYKLTDEQIDFLARGFHRYWTGPDAKDGGLKGDWKRTWHTHVDSQVARRLIPQANGANGVYPTAPAGRNSTSYFSFDDGVER